MIKNIKAREILNSRGEFTVEAELETENGVFLASCPSGASKGESEAVEIRASKAVENIEDIIAPAIRGKLETEQREVDQFLIELDGTKDKSNLGANAVLPVSVAVLRAGAEAKKIPLYRHIESFLPKPISAGLPIPCFNIINGGVHSGSDLEIQEFMVVPGKGLFSENLRAGSHIYQELKKVLIKSFGKKAVNVGDEGGFVPPVFAERDGLNLLKTAIAEHEDTDIGLDCAASQFYKKESYEVDKTFFTKEGLLELYSDFVRQYPIIFLEDPFSDSDQDSFQEITKKLGKKITVFGDDFLTTNVERMKEAKKREACNGAVIKPNQIGTVTETLEAVALARSFGWKIMIAHRSGETADDFIADLAVGTGADFIKSGAPARGERTAKYNRLLKIEKEIRDF